MLSEDLVPEQPSSPDEAQLAAMVEARVARLLQGPLRELQQVLYRLDIPEAQAAEAMADAVPEKTLARLILAREQEKAASRAQHRRPFNASEESLLW